MLRRTKKTTEKRRKEKARKDGVKLRRKFTEMLPRTKNSVKTIRKGKKKKRLNHIEEEGMQRNFLLYIRYSL